LLSVSDSDLKDLLRRILPNLNGISPHLFRIFAAILLAGIVAHTIGTPAIAGEFEASGFVLRNHSPFSAIIGIPGRWPDGTNDVAELSWNTSNHAMFEMKEPEYLLLDGETQTISVRWQRRLSKRVQLGIEIPWLKHSGGFLDNTIDAWHDLTGLPEGIRPQTDSNELRYVFAADGPDVLRFEDSTSGLGDIQASLAVDLGSFDESVDAGYLKRIPWKLKLSAEVPTGNIEKLTGNDNTDLAAGIGARSPHGAGSRFGWWLDIGLVWPGDVAIDGLDPSGQIFYYDTALAWRLHRKFDFLVQIAGSSAVYRSRIPMLGEPTAQIGVGGLWHISTNYGLRFGLFEDLRAETAPDFGIEITLIFKAF